MDELVIGDQKYISSKRAAEITGYAKDYIGQLCREGRVEARLVGRSWYVREAAINDHRFGAENAAVGVFNTEAVVHTDKEWESPKYEAEVVEELPVAEVKEEDPRNTAERMQEAWQAWFAQNKVEEEPVSIEIERIPEPEPEPEPLAEPIPESEEEVPVLITRVEEPEEEVEPAPALEIHQEEKPLRIVGMPIAAPRRSYMSLKIALVVLGVSAVLISSVGTGYLVLPRIPMVAAVIDALSGERFIER